MTATRSHAIFQRAFSSLCAQIRQCCLQKLLFDSTCLIFSTPLKRSRERASTKLNCKCFTHFQSFALRWESRIRNISHTHHTGIHCFGGLFDKPKARQFKVQILLIGNFRPPHFSEADFATLSCTPGREEAHLWIVYMYVKRLTSHQVGTLWQVHGKISKAITNFLDKDIAHSLLEICLYYCLQTV